MSDQPKKRGGRPAFVPSARDRSTVGSMLSYGMVESDVAAALGIDPKTLRKHFAVEIRTAFINANALVKQSLFLTATSWMQEKDQAGVMIGKPSREATLAAIFWDKTRGGAIETTNVNSRAKVEAITDAKVEVHNHAADVESARILDELAARLAAGPASPFEVAGNGARKADPPAR